MSKLGAWKLRLAVLAGLSAATVAWAADTDDDEPGAPKKGRVWVANWFTERSTNGSKKMPPKADKSSKEPAKKPEPKPDPAQVKRAKELADYLRRLAVCDQLTQVAFDTRDDELLKQVNQLKERVWLTYKLRTVGPKSHPESDEQILDKHLGPTAAADEKTYEPLLGKGSPKDRAGQTASKEDFRR